MTLVIEENDYQQWECRGGDHTDTVDETGCGDYFEKKKENDWKIEWKKRTNS